MTFPKNFLAVLAISAASIGCAPNIENKEAVKKGVIDYFEKKSPSMGLDLKGMVIEVVAVEFRNKEAKATVAFRPKASKTNEALMQMTYVLEQKGGKWEVKGRPSAATDTHAPAPEGPAAPAGALPPNHPPTGAAPALPPNHPPIDPKTLPKN